MNEKNSEDIDKITNEDIEFIKHMKGVEGVSVIDKQSLDITINNNEVNEKSSEPLQEACSHKPMNNNQNSLPPKLPKNYGSKCLIDNELQPSSNKYNSNGPADEAFDFVKWFKDNNPLYLLSVLFMLLGLHLVSSDVKASNLGVGSLLGFFAVQNLYELVMVGMALYLLKFQVQSGHGKLLLVFVMLFLGDVTFYQVRISGLSVFYGNIATMIYMGLAGLKLAAVIKVLGLKLYHWRIFYVFSSFSLIWIGPKIAYNIMDSLGINTSSHFDPTTIIYLIWVFAGLIHLPIIIKNWFNNKICKEEYNKLVGNETSFWRCLMIFPFIMMPIQLLINVMADSSFAMSQTTPAIALTLPWLIMAALFAQTLWKKIVAEMVGVNAFDSFILILALIIALATSHVELPICIMNFTLIVSGLFITYYTRGNLVNGVAIGFTVVYFSGYKLITVGSSAVKYGAKISKTAWAGILMVGSFIFLGLGFLTSLGKKDKKDTKDKKD